MKIKTTKKAVKDNYPTIIGIGYCQAQHLLSRQNAFGYSAGSNGWACDYYELNGICISEGYSPINQGSVKSDYDTLRRYELEAEKVRYDHSIPYEQQTEKINQLLKDFVNECIK